MWVWVSLGHAAGRLTDLQDLSEVLRDEVALEAHHAPPVARGPQHLGLRLLQLPVRPTSLEERHSLNGSLYAHDAGRAVVPDASLQVLAALRDSHTCKTINQSQSRQYIMAYYTMESARPVCLSYAHLLRPGPLLGQPHHLLLHPGPLGRQLRPAAPTCPSSSASSRGHTAINPMAQRCTRLTSCVLPSSSNGIGWK